MKLTLALLMLALAGGAYAVGYQHGYRNGYHAADGMWSKWVHGAVLLYDGRGDMPK